MQFRLIWEGNLLTDFSWKLKWMKGKVLRADEQWPDLAMKCQTKTVKKNYKNEHTRALEGYHVSCWKLKSSKFSSKIWKRTMTAEKWMKLKLQGPEQFFFQKGTNTKWIGNEDLWHIFKSLKNFGRFFFVLNENVHRWIAIVQINR